MSSTAAGGAGGGGVFDGSTGAGGGASSGLSEMATLPEEETEEVWCMIVFHSFVIRSPACLLMFPGYDKSGVARVQVQD